MVIQLCIRGPLKVLFLLLTGRVVRGKSRTKFDFKVLAQFQACLIEYALHFRAETCLDEIDFFHAITYLSSFLARVVPVA